jgi:hypothetical protein
MKNGLARKRSTSSSQPISSGNSSAIAPLFLNHTSNDENANPNKKPKLGTSGGQTLSSSIFTKGGCLALALQNNRATTKSRTSFARTVSNGTNSTTGTTNQDTTSSSYLKSIAFNHVVFSSIENNGSRSQSRPSQFGSSTTNNSSRMFSSFPIGRQQQSKSHTKGSLFSQSVINV